MGLLACMYLKLLHIIYNEVIRFKINRAALVFSVFLKFVYVKILVNIFLLFKVTFLS